MPLRNLFVAVATATLLTFGVSLSQAQTPAPEETPSVTPPAATVDRVDRDDPDFDWGWLGLIGLLGLAGLAGRNREVMTTRRTTVRNDNI
jgi:hypothetical protein